MSSSVCFPPPPQTPLKEQQGPERGTTDVLEQMSSKDIATELTNYDWELFTAMHEVAQFTRLIPKQKRKLLIYTGDASSR